MLIKPEIQLICMMVWQSLPFLKWWYTNVTYWCSAVVFDLIHTVLYAKITKPGLFLYTHPYLHMYIHLHVLYYKSDIYPSNFF